MVRDVEKIAKGLSTAQKWYLTGPARSIANPPRWFLNGYDATAKATLPTRTVLLRKGLLEDGRFGPTMLTDLGLAVRSYLKGSRDD